jgi:hypothetical protein
MSYPIQAEVLGVDPLLPWIDEHLLRADPFAFRDVGFRPLVTSVASELDVDANGIYIIGSGAIGLSLNPKNIVNGALKAFDDQSDIDLAVISETYFESAWRELRRAAQPTLDEIPEELRKNLDWQRKRFFDGAILAHVLLPFLSFGTRWQTALVRIGEQVARSLDREIAINVWIYRDYWSLRNYVAAGIVRCRERTT